MIMRAATKIYGEVLVAGEGERHDVSAMLAVAKYEVTRDNHVHGFVTDTGEFLDRKEAAEHAYQSKQIPHRVSILVSEDLW